MPNEPADGARRTVSRRHLFKQAAGAAAALSATTPALVTAQPVAAPAPPAPHLQTSRLEALETLTAAEADTLEAIVARLIPSDANGPGATEARAAQVIGAAVSDPQKIVRIPARGLAGQHKRFWREERGKRRVG